ncbi:MAG: hypothetical protein J6Z33_05835 [Lachnospiraceae bacterium]|nr:hypothetical protein [Lachnospiraceae bacterium]
MRDWKIGKLMNGEMIMKRRRHVAALIGMCLACFVLVFGFAGCEAGKGAGKETSLSEDAASVSEKNKTGEGQDHQGQGGEDQKGQNQQGQGDEDPLGAGDQSESGADFGVEFEEEEMEAFRRSIQREDVHVMIPGMKGSKTLVYLSDLHVIADTSQVAAADLEDVELRMNHWSAYDGMTAADAWTLWVDYLNTVTPEGVLLGADMVDFASKANVESFKKGLERLDIPWLYVRADHDLAPSYLDGVFETESWGYQREIKGFQDAFGENAEEGAGASRTCLVDGDFSDVMTMEFADFIVAGWNNSTAQMTEAGLAKMREVFAQGKPVILLTHVPIQPLVEAAVTATDATSQTTVTAETATDASDQANTIASTISLTAASQEAWNGNVLLWGRAGTGTFYVPNETTAAFLEMIYNDDTPVVEILCGHLHFSWDGQVTPKVHEHVFGPAMERCMGVVTVSSEP